MSATQFKLDVRGIETSVQRGGRGEPLLYLHSASAESSSWNEAFEGLAKKLDVIAPVHPGFPGSGGLQRINGIADLVLHCVDLMNALSLPCAHIVGSSLGGWIGAEIASLYPERVSSLVLVDAAGLWLDEAPMLEVFGLLPGDLAERLFYDQQHPIAQMLHQMGEMETPPPDDVLLSFYESTAAAARIAWNPYFHDPALERRLDRIIAPTLVLWGAEDGLIPRQHGERYRDRIRDAKLRLIDECGHLPVLEKPRALVDEVTKFIEALPDSES